MIIGFVFLLVFLFIFFITNEKKEFIASYYLVGIISTMILLNMLGVNTVLFSRILYTLVLLILILFIKNNKISKNIFKLNTFRFLIGFYSLLLVYTIAFSHLGSIVFFLKTILIQTIIPILAILFFITTKRFSIQTLIQWCVYWSFPIGILTILKQYISGGMMLDPGLYSSMDIFPIDVARLLSLCIILGMYLVSKKQNTIFNSLILLLNFYNLIQTGSRQGIQFLIISLTLYFLIKMIFFKRYNYFYKSILIIITIFSIVNIINVIDRYSAIINVTKLSYAYGIYDDQSSNYRYDMVTPAINLFKKYPFGIGPDNFSHYSHKVGISNNTLRGNSIHGLLLSILVELGLFGFIFFCYYYMKMGIINLKLLIKSKTEFNYTLVMVIYTSALLLIGVKFNTAQIVFFCMLFSELSLYHLRNEKYNYGI